MSNYRIDSPTYNRGIERVLHAEHNLAEAVGFPVTKQFRAMADKYLKPLTHLVTDALHNCHGNRDRLVRSAIFFMGNLSDEDIALRILVAAGEAGSTAVHSFGITAWWLPLGKAMGFKGELALKVGEWAFDLLLRLPIFDVALDDGNLALALGEDGLDEFLDATLRQSALHRPDLLPLKQPPVPWTQVYQGVFPPDHEIKLKLINSGPSVEAAWQQAISSGLMDEALRAINYLKSISLPDKYSDTPITTKAGLTRNTSQTESVAHTAASHLYEAEGQKLGVELFTGRGWYHIRVGTVLRASQVRPSRPSRFHLSFCVPACRLLPCVVPVR